MQHGSRTWLARLKSNGSDRIEFILVAGDILPSGVIQNRKGLVAVPLHRRLQHGDVLKCQRLGGAATVIFSVAEACDSGTECSNVDLVRRYDRDTISPELLEA